MWFFSLITTILPLFSTLAPYYIISNKIYDGKIKEFNDSQGFKRERNHRKQYHKRITRIISRLGKVLPIATRSALIEKQLISMIKSPIMTYRKISSEINHYDLIQKANSDPNNILPIDKILDSGSHYYEDFMPIYESVRRYPYGIDH